MVLAGLTGAAQAALQLMPGDKPDNIFGGAPSSIRVAFSNSSDQDFNAEIRTRIYQTSSTTAVLVNDAAWKTLRVLPQQTVLDTAPLDFPTVKAETKFLVQWLAESNRVIGTTEVWVYPTNLLAQLKPLLDGGHLGVLDPNDELKPLLRQNAVTFVDLEAANLEDFSGKLAILGPFHAQSELPKGLVRRIKAAAVSGVAVLWLQPSVGPRDRLQPSYYTVMGGTNAIVVADSALVSNLLTSPTAQLRLMQLCKQTLRPEPISLPDANLQP